MLKKNTKYTAREIVAEAGIDAIHIAGGGKVPDRTFEGDEIFEKFSVNIGGISGIADPNKVIFISPETEQLVVMVAGQAMNVLTEKGSDEQAISAGARIALDAELGLE